MGSVAHAYHVAIYWKDRVTHAPFISACVLSLEVLLLVRLYDCAHCADGLSSRPPNANPDMNSQEIMDKQGGFSGLFIR